MTYEEIQDRDPQTSWPLPLDEHPRLEIDASAAQMMIVPLAPGERPRLEALGRDAERVRADIEAGGGTTHVRVRGEGGFLGFGRHVRARLVLHVPHAVDLRAHTEAGRLRVHGLRRCRLTLETEAGEVDLRDVHGALVVRTEAGRVEGEGLAGSLDVSTSAGAVRLEILHLEPGVHRVHTSVGAAHLELARGMQVRIDARTAMGVARVSYPSTREAAAVLDLVAEVGAVKVREAHARWAPIVDDVVAGGPYRAPSPIAPIPPAPAAGASIAEADAVRTAPLDDVEADAALASILQRVADGSLTPKDAAELLRGLGHVER
jgi:hypothetical protein